MRIFVVPPTGDDRNENYDRTVDVTPVHGTIVEGSINTSEKNGNRVKPNAGDDRNANEGQPNAATEVFIDLSDDSFQIEDEPNDENDDEDATYAADKDEDFNFDDADVGDDVEDAAKLNEDCNVENEHACADDASEYAGLKDENDELDRQTEYDPSEELISLANESDDDDGNCVTSTNLNFNVRRDLRIKKLQVGQKFGSAAEFREAVRDIVIKRKFDLTFVRNDGDRVTIICKQECGWKIRGSSNTNDDSFQVREFNDKHNCTGVRVNGHVTYSYIAKHYIGTVRADPGCTVAGIADTVEKDLHVVVTKQKVRRAKSLAIQLIEGNHEQQFGRARDYWQLVLQSNLGSVANGPYGGHMLVAVGRDANNGLFPIAIACVESECRDSWEWFLNELMGLVGNYLDFTFISDRQKGLVEIFENMYRGADIRFCLKHLYDNFKLKYKGTRLKNLYWDAATAYTTSEFELYMQEMRNVDKNAYE
ncbi:uncharacterized protein LOC132282226 [Cornus florida]|uniref:uncharacterized protein LOC132282226 n=1 Tax=Cornus florida TaxID=4283 RepID=UPI002899924F|nr:uncharacterized protein LOC132282226 [Cornus florida]